MDRSARIMFRPGNFVNQQVDTLRELDEIVRRLRVSGQNRGVAPVVDPVSKRRTHRGVIDQKCRDLDVVGRVDNALVDVCHVGFDAVGGKLLVDIARIRMSNANAFCRWPTMSRVPRGPHTCNGTERPDAHGNR